MGQGAGQGSVGAQLEERYFLQKVKLGQGSFGTVWRAVDRHKGDVVAIKQLDKASLPRRGVTRQDIEREIQMMKACPHDNITQLFNTFEDDKSIYLALEYCDGGDFGDKVKERGLFATETEVAEWMQQMCAAITGMHSKLICHRDIKPDNFMVQGNPGKLKLSDFGLAIYLPKGKLLQEKCGTPAFMSPEQHHLPKRSPGYSFPADMWAVGVSMYMMMFGGKHPFLNDRGGLDDQMLLNGELDFKDTTQRVGFFGGLAGLAGASLRYSEEARALCKRMVEPDPQKRIIAAETDNYKWLQCAQQQAAAQEAAAAAPPQVGKEEHRRSATPTVVDVDKTMHQPSHEDRRSSTPRNTPPRSRDRDKDDEKAGRPGKNGKSDRDRSITPGPEGRKALDQAAKLTDENALLRAELEERKKREEEILMKEKRVEMQQKIFTKQKTKELEEVEQKRVNIEAESEALRRQREELERQRQQAAAAEALSKAAALSALPPSAASSSSGPPLARGRSAPDRTSMPDKATSSSRRRLLGPGMRCRYESGTYGWMPAVIQGYNDTDGTYNLDVRQHASLDRIAPIKEVTAKEAWPPGSWALYLSATVNEWLPARVVSFNESDSTYNLDVRDHAEVDRVRARTDKPVDRHDGGEVDSRRTSNGRPSLEHQQTRALSSHEASRHRSRGYPDDGDEGGRRRSAPEATSAGGTLSTSPSSASTRLVTRGDVCVIPEHGLVFIENGAGHDGCYVVKVSDNQKINVKADVMRAPKESKFAWPKGTKVSYLSASVGQWIDAHVVSFNASNGTYNLDVREQAAPDKVRPR